jgi:hypothetical protein
MSTDITSAEQWLDRVEQTINRLVADKSRDHSREIAEYQKMLARFKRALDDRTAIRQAR